MSEQAEQREDLEGWPMPTREVRRELERPAPTWYGVDADSDGAPVGVAA